jgi:hypothetical protein
MDLHKTQRVVRPGPEAGTVWVDGSLYTSALPRPTASARAPTAGMTAAEKARRREAFDAREPYRFVPHAKRDTKRGAQRFRGPAVDGHPFKVRCPNTPASMRMPHTIPTTTCVPGEPCGCGKTLTIHDSLLERDRQHHPWQSTRWALSFNRRTLVEGLIGANRYQRLSVNRGFFRQTGLVATALLMAVTLIGHNLVSLHAWHTNAGDPSRGRSTSASPSTTDRSTRPPGPAADASADRLTGPARASPSTEWAPACPETAKTAKPAPRHTKSASARGPTTPHDPRTTKLPAGSPPAGSFGKPKRVVQGTTHTCARGDLNPHVLADTGT